MKAKIRSGALLSSGDDDFILKGQPPSKLEIRFGKPERIEAPIFPKQALCVKFPHWLYEVTISFEASSPFEARDKGWGKLESLIEVLSFLGSVPVLIEKRGSITNSPESPVKGVEYEAFFHPDEMEVFGENLPVLEEAHIQALTNILVPDELPNDRDGHLERALHWLHHSHFGMTVGDQFASMMAAFEAVSQLLTDTPNQTRTCPDCGHSTVSRPSGKFAMGWFVIKHLNWSDEKWNKCWALRSHLLHGGRPKDSEVGSLLLDVEAAVLNACHKVLKFSHPILRARARAQFSNAELHVKYTVPDRERNSVSEGDQQE